MEETRKFKITIGDNVYKTLDKYGFDYIKNIQEMLEEMAYYIWMKESNKNEKDIGTETANEVRRQNNDL